MNFKYATATKTIILALDTSGPRLQLALFFDAQTRIFSEDIAKGHAEILFNRLEVFLSQNKVSYSDISKIAVTTGPGSFTGLRIGIAAARGLGLALKKPVIGIPNLLALSLRGPKTPFSIIVDAKRSQFYVQGFFGQAKPDGPPKLVSKEQLPDKKTALSNDVLYNPRIDMEAMVVFCANIKPNDYPPQPTYVRPPDAKPQTKLAVARQ